jgi:hypothetical protein
MTAAAPFQRRSVAGSVRQAGKPAVIVQRPNGRCDRESVSPSVGDDKPRLPPPRHRGSRGCRDGNDVQENTK